MCCKLTWKRLLQQTLVLLVNTFWYYGNVLWAVSDLLYVVNQIC